MAQHVSHWPASRPQRRLPAADGWSRWPVVTILCLLSACASVPPVVPPSVDVASDIPTKQPGAKQRPGPDAPQTLAGQLPAEDAIDTDLVVRVLARDAMFIGPSMGIRVTVRNAISGELLAEGITIGGTGSKERIMQTPRARGDRLASEETAVFRTTLSLREPTRIEVTAEGPIGFPHAVNRVSSTQWVMPGRHLNGGDGWVLELAGFVVEIESPSEPLIRRVDGAAIELRAKVVMMCGCPTESGGTWDADAYEVEAWVYGAGKLLTSTRLTFAGEESIYRGRYVTVAPGDYSVLVFAYDAATGNTGIDRVEFEVK